MIRLYVLILLTFSFQKFCHSQVLECFPALEHLDELLNERRSAIFLSFYEKDEKKSNNYILSFSNNESSLSQITIEPEKEYKDSFISNYLMDIIVAPKRKKILYIYEAKKDRDGLFKYHGLFWIFRNNRLISVSSFCYDKLMETVNISKKKKDIKLTDILTSEKYMGDPLGDG